MVGAAVGVEEPDDPEAPPVFGVGLTIEVSVDAIGWPDPLVEAVPLVAPVFASDVATSDVSTDASVPLGVVIVSSTVESWVAIGDRESLLDSLDESSEPHAPVTRMAASARAPM